MKLLRSPIFTTCLVVVAILVVLYQLNSPRMRFGRIFGSPALAARSSLPAPAPATAVPPALTKPLPGKEPAGASTNRIARDVVEVRFASWVDWPKRDPFLLLTPEPEEILTTTETNSPVPTWKLRAIWAQTGGRLAVINRGAYREGDEIEGYKIDKIDTGGVWFIGPREKERLSFDTKPKPAPTNSVPAGTKP
jgi:hypothetical protein